VSIDFYGKRADGKPITLRHNHPRNLNMSNVNARAFLEYLGLPYECSYGEADIHTIRRAIIKATALLDRRTVPSYINKAYIQDKLKKLSATVETLGGMGATVIYWA
jgi:hypothetical protein